MPAYYDVWQRTTTYASVLLTFTKLTHNVFDVCQLGSANFSYVGIRWLKRQGVTAASHFDVECDYDLNRRAAAF